MCLAASREVRRRALVWVASTFEAAAEQQRKLKWLRLRRWRQQSNQGGRCADVVLCRFEEPRTHVLRQGDVYTKPKATYTLCIRCLQLVRQSRIKTAAKVALLLAQLIKLAAAFDTTAVQLPQRPSPRYTSLSS